MNRLHSFVMTVVIGVLTACGGGGGGSSITGGNTGGGGGTVSGPPMSITTTTVPDGVYAKPYSAQLAATGGITPYKWTALTAMPSGLTLGSDGTVAGIMGSAATVNIQVRDSGVPAQSATATIKFNAFPELNIYTSSVPGGHINVPYDFVVQSAGVKTWSISGGSLPSGFQLVSPSITQVEISGTTTQTGSFTFAIKAESTSNPAQVATKAFTIVIDDNPAVLSDTVPDFIRGRTYQAVLQAVNGKPPYHWQAISGLLPGIALDANTGTLAGTTGPTAFLGAFNTTVQVTDSDTPARSGTRALPIVVVDPLQVTGGTQVATLNQPFYGGGNAYGGRQPFHWSLTSGNVPPGLSLNPTTGQFTGTPTQLGEFNGTLHLQDATNPPQTVDLNYKITVSPPVLILIASLPNHMPLGGAFSGFASAQGGTPPYVWQVVGGGVPPGLQVDSSTGEVSGTPTTLGQYNFTLRVTDSGSPAQTATQTYPMTVSVPLGRNNSIQTATAIGNGATNASISPYGNPADTADPDVDYYKITLTNGVEASLSIYAKQYNNATPLDSVLEIVDANGARLSYCNPPSVQTGPFTSECLNDDIQQGTVQDSMLTIKVPGTTGTTNVFAKVFDWRGDARPDMTYILMVNGVINPLKFTDPQLFGTSVGQPYNWCLGISGGTFPISVSLFSGSLPPGLNLSSNCIIGSPTQSGVYNFTLQVVDSGTPVQTVQKQFSIKVTDALTIVTQASFPDACVGKPYSFTMQGTGGFPPYIWQLFNSTFGNTGLNFNIMTGVWTGTPTTTGTFSGNIQIHDTSFANSYNQIASVKVNNCN